MVSGEWVVYGTVILYRRGLLIITKTSNHL